MPNHSAISLWPRGRIFNALRLFLAFNSGILKLERVLADNFRGGYPVICSSGRLALYLALREEGLTRANEIKTFSYASHCVLDAISRVATPVNAENTKQNINSIIYHQYGFFQKKQASDNVIIEDSVDSLYKLGGEVLTGGGMYEIWSMPKILGSTSGGILWCKDENTKKRICKYLENRRAGSIVWLLRLLGRKYKFFHYLWQGVECEYGAPTNSQAKEVLGLLKKWNKIWEDREKNFNIIWEYSIEGLIKPESRLPCIVPIEHDIFSDDEIRGLGLEGCKRHFQMVTAGGIKMDLPILAIPIHQDIDSQRCINIRNKIRVKLKCQK
jgi:putative PLP-dependent aminotransferase (TIGR04422 family)